jgi:hypothetical protein
MTRKLEDILLPPKRSRQRHKVKLLVRAVLGKENKNVTFNTQRERYYSHVYVSRRLWLAVCLLAKANGLTRMQVVDQVLEVGLSRVLGDAVLEQLRRSELSKQGRQSPPSPIIKELKRLAKARGYNPGYLF